MFGDGLVVQRDAHLTLSQISSAAAIHTRPLPAIGFCVGLFAGTHMLGFTISGESVRPALIGSAAAIVNGICFIVGGVLEAVPGWACPTCLKERTPGS